jgi:hypothetical protein
MLFVLVGRLSGGKCALPTTEHGARAGTVPVALNVWTMIAFNLLHANSSSCLSLHQLVPQLGRSYPRPS